jgi:serine/threonine protein kinase
VDRQIGDYRILREIGRGGMGVVYLAEQENPHRQVALKVISVGYTSEVSLKRFEHEAQVLGRLQHPGVAQIFEAGTFDLGDGPQPFFAMEYIDGLPLTAYAEINHLDLRQRLDLMVKVCEAIHHAHQKGVIHRDLKPGNILVDSHGQPKVLDFGIARLASETALRQSLTVDGSLLGTPAYMAPERFSSQPYDGKSDVYSLGITLYQMLAGRLPFVTTHRDPLAMAMMQREEEPAPLTGLDPPVPEVMVAVVLQALRKDPAERPSAEELARLLAQAAGLPTRAPSGGGSAGPGGPGSPTPPTPVSQAAQAGKRAPSAGETPSSEPPLRPRPA